MWRVARALAWLLGCGALATNPVPAAPWDEVVPWLSRVQGGLQGNYTPAEGHPVKWRLRWAEADGTTRRGHIEVTADDLALRVELVFDREADRLNWRVIEGRLNLAAWLTVLARRPEWAESLAGLTATGELALAGAGEWTPHALTGDLRATLDQGTLRNAEQDWTLAGVSLRAGGSVAELVSGRLPLALDVKTITTGRFGARELTVRATLVDGGRVDVATAAVEIAGGRVAAKPFAVTLAETKLSMELALERVGLADVAALVPDLLAEGSGRVNGTVGIRWSEADGLGFGNGSLTIDPSERAEVRFRPNPGLLTGSLPPRVLSLYPGLANLETGRATLLAERLDVRFSPDGDADGRTATVVIAGGPVDKNLKAPLVLTINVRGPLAPLVTFGTKMNTVK